MKIRITSLILSLLIVGCTPNQNQTPSSNQNNTNQPAVEVFDFDSCVKAGNPILKSNPPQCRHDGITYIEKTTTTSKEIKCQPSQRDAEVCAEIYQPVCAKVNIQCVKAPCPPINETFSSACHACRNSLVESYIEGECQTN